MGKSRYARKCTTQDRVSSNYIKESIKTAKELGYGNSVVEKLEKATTETEISRILSDARRSGDE